MSKTKIEAGRVTFQVRLEAAERDAFKEATEREAVNASALVRKLMHDWMMKRVRKPKRG